MSVHFTTVSKENQQISNYCRFLDSKFWSDCCRKIWHEGGTCTASTLDPPRSCEMTGFIVVTERPDFVFAVNSYPEVIEVL